MAQVNSDLPLKRGEFLPVEADAAAGAVDDARPDRWGERVIRLLDRPPPRLSTVEFLYFSGDDRFGALGVSTSSSEYLPHRHGPMPTLADVQAMHDLIRQVEAGEAVPDAFAAQAEQLIRRMVFNILIDNTDDHEKNHVLVVNEAQRYRLSPAFDVLPSGRALGYQQMCVGRDGADSTLDNALSGEPCVRTHQAARTRGLRRGGTRGQRLARALHEAGRFGPRYRAARRPDRPQLSARAA